AASAWSPGPRSRPRPARAPQRPAAAPSRPSRPPRQRRRPRRARRSPSSAPRSRPRPGPRDRAAAGATAAARLLRGRALGLVLLARLLGLLELVGRGIERARAGRDPDAAAAGGLRVRHVDAVLAHALGELDRLVEHLLVDLAVALAAVGGVLL